MNISGRRVGPASCLLLVLALVSPTLAPGPLDAQVVRGHVLDDSTRLGVADVTVRAVAGTARVLRSVTTGASGEFLLDLPDSATVRLEGTRPGWSSVTSQPLHVPRGDTVTVEFWLSVRPIPVAPLYVTARSNLGRSRFRAHMEDWGKGIFFTPAMVDSIAPIHPVDLLRGQEDTWLTWRFGERRPLPDIRTFRGDGCVKFMINGLEVRRWAEGVRTVSGADAFEETALEMLHGREIVAAEYYRYPGEAPPELRRYLELEGEEAGSLRMCGLVVYWTAEGW